MGVNLICGIWCQWCLLCHQRLTIITLRENVHGIWHEWELQKITRIMHMFVSLALGQWYYTSANTAVMGDMGKSTFSMGSQEMINVAKKHGRTMWLFNVKYTTRVVVTATCIRHVDTRMLFTNTPSHQLVFKNWFAYTRKWNIACSDNRVSDEYIYLWKGGGVQG